MSELDRIVKRHADIPQDALPGCEVVLPGAGTGEVKRATQKSVGWAVCPHHLHERTERNDGNTGLVRSADGELVFREHTKRIGSVSVRCSGSGTPPTPSPGIPAPAGPTRKDDR